MQEAEKARRKVKHNRHMHCINIRISKGIIQNRELLPIRNQSKSKLKTNKNKINQNKQPNQFIYVQDNQDK